MTREATVVKAADQEHRAYWFLVEQLTTNTNHFDTHSLKHKDLYRRLRYASMILTALMTAVAATAVAHAAAQPWLNLVVVGMSSVLAVLASVEGLRKPSELWIHERTMYYALTDLRRELDFRCANGVDDKAVESCFARMQALLGASTEKWHKDITSKSSVA